MAPEEGGAFADTPVRSRAVGLGITASSNRRSFREGQKRSSPVGRATSDVTSGTDIEPRDRDVAEVPLPARRAASRL